MAQSQQHNAKSVLRLLLRAVDQHVTRVSGNQQWRQHVLAQFRQSRGLDAAQQQRMLTLAQEYAELIKNVAHHQELLVTYNIGLDPDSRNKQMVEKTAARVGFRLPGAGADAAAAAATAAGAGSGASKQVDGASSIPGKLQQQQQQEPGSEPPQRQRQQQQPSGSASSSRGLQGSGSWQASEQQQQQQPHVGPAVLAATA